MVIILLITPLGNMKKIDFEIEHDNFKSLEKISDVLPILLK